ncbi:MAG: bifunctional transcriptional activator/DNA repair enzyme protein Ada, partial [Rhodanobacteraceae bacterium]
MQARSDCRRAICNAHSAAHTAFRRPSTRARRFGEFKRALREGANITDAIFNAGFGSASRVYENTDRLLGMLPARYRQGGQNVAIRYTTLACPLGRVLIAATERGLCAVNV